jgi:hypothetical protein
MAQTIQIYRTNSNTPPTTLLSGVLSAELGAQTKLWIGSGSGNRLLLSSDPADSSAAGGAYLKLAGGTLTGALTLAADPAAALQPATKQYTDAKDALRLLLTGGTLTGPLTLAADPAAALQPATKQYVDAINTTLAAADTTIRSTYLPLAGGTLTGALTLAADPAAPLQAATRQYVDAKPSGATILATAPASPVAGQLWWDSVGGQLYVYYNDGTSQQWVPASTVPGNTAAANNVGRNLVHNPLFNVRQRGDGGFPAVGYTADRWFSTFGGGTQAITFQNVGDPGRAAIGDEAADNQLTNTFAGTSGAGDYTAVVQFIEHVRRLAGKTVTVSFYAAASATFNLGVNLTQLFGTGGSPSATTAVAGQRVAVTTAWTRFSLTFTMPSATGKTVGTNGNDCTQLAFWFSSGATNAANAGNVGVQSGTIVLWGVQLEVGSVATPLEKPDPRYDLANCQRFYQQVICNVRATGAAVISLLSPATWSQMRATPTTTLGATGVIGNAGSPALTGSNAFGGYFTGSTLAAGDGYLLNFVYNLSADL